MWYVFNDQKDLFNNMTSAQVMKRADTMKMLIRSTNCMTTLQSFCFFLLSLGGSSPLVHVFVHVPSIFIVQHLHCSEALAACTGPVIPSWCLDSESTFTSNFSSPCSHFFILLLNLLIKHLISDYIKLFFEMST